MSESKPASPAVTSNALETRLLRLEAENAALKAQASSALGVEVVEQVPGPATYRLTKQSFIGGALLEAGATIVMEKPHRPGRSWVRVDVPKSATPATPAGATGPSKPAGKPGRAVDAEV